MRFFEVLAQVVGLLVLEQRLSYQALKRLFELDDAYIEDLKVELIEVRRLARDHKGRMLVWTGEGLTLPAPLAPRVAVHAMAHDQQPTLTAQPSRVVPTAEAERRQLTVLCCDLVGSTMLSGQLAPEDLRAVVRAYQETAAGVIQRYEGHIAHYLGDGLLVYFGSPQAHEDDAQRAVHTGVELVEAIGGLHTRLEASDGVPLAVRLGIHTGPVLGGDIGGGGRHEQLALGETPNIAARLAGLAAPHSVVIRPVTARRVRQTFVLEDLGAATLKGVAEPMAVSRVLGRRTPSRHDDEATPDRTPFLVGRDAELGLLRRRWAQSGEDLHWADPTTLELLGLLVEPPRPLPCCTCSRSARRVPRPGRGARL